MARGSVKKRISGRTGAVSCQVRVELPPVPVSGNRRQGSETYRTRKEAETRLSAWLQEIERGEAVMPSTVTVGELLQQWLTTVAAHSVKPKSLTAYTYTIRHYIVAELGAVQAQKLTPARVQAFYAELLAGGKGPETVRKCHQRLSQALEWAVSMGTLSRNVCDRVDPPTVPRKEAAIWSHEQARAFLSHAGSWETLFRVFLSTGMRRGEVLGLRWEDFDVERQTVSIRQTVIDLAGKTVIQDSPKTPAARRTVLLPFAAVTALRHHRAVQNEHRLRLGPLWEDHGLIFPNLYGGPLHPRNVLRAFDRIVTAAGVPRITLHELRHTHASWLLIAGRPIHEVSRRIGHSKASTTLDLYAHTLANSQDEAAAIIGALLAAKDPEAAAS